MSIIAIAARLRRHPDPSSATAPQAVAGSHGAVALISFVHHWPLLFIMAGATGMIAWIGTTVWAAISLLLWMLGRAASDQIPSGISPATRV